MMTDDKKIEYVEPNRSIDFIYDRMWDPEVPVDKTCVRRVMVVTGDPITDLAGQMRIPYRVERRDYFNGWYDKIKPVFNKRHYYLSRDGIAIFNGNKKPKLSKGDVILVYTGFNKDFYNEQDKHVLCIEDINAEGIPVDTYYSKET